MTGKSTVLVKDDVQSSVRQPEAGDDLGMQSLNNLLLSKAWEASKNNGNDTSHRKAKPKQPFSRSIQIEYKRYKTLKTGKHQRPKQFALHIDGWYQAISTSSYYIMHTIQER